MLNLFRQRHDYKEGTYIKIWNGEEDNVVLARLMSALDPAQADFADQLRLSWNRPTNCSSWPAAAFDKKRRLASGAFLACRIRVSAGRTRFPEQRLVLARLRTPVLARRVDLSTELRGACQGQRGSYAMPRASASICPLATISSAWAASVISPTAIVGMPTRRLSSAAKGTW